MNGTGIGYAGIEGVWWLPAIEPYRLPKPVQEALNRIGPAIFAFFDAAVRLYGEGCAPLVQLLDFKVPAHLVSSHPPGRIECLRPDFQLVPDEEGKYRLALTEIESCPSAQGFAHAMQVGYGLETDLVAAFARYLNGRSFLIAGTQRWSQFLFEQLAFSRALDTHGATGRVLYDLPVAKIAAEVRLGHRWQPPMFGIPFPVPEWDNAVGARIYRAGFLPYLWPDDDGWPEGVGESVVFRFGYVDCFKPAHIENFRQWAEQGATLLNPPHHVLDNKALLAAIHIPELRQELDRDVLDVLERCLPETHLLTADIAAQLLAEKNDWVLKFAGFDTEGKSWGGQSLVIGRQIDSARWREAVESNRERRWPVIAQRYTHTAHIDIDYFSPDGEINTYSKGRSRLRAFFLRDDPAACGVHMTVSGRGYNVSESIESVQAPVVFGEE